MAVFPNFFQVYNIKYEGALKAGEKDRRRLCWEISTRSLYKTGDTDPGMDGEDYRVTDLDPGEYYIAPGGEQRSLLSG